jgi:DNA-binding IclR family transcriptional regulator
LSGAALSLRRGSQNVHEGAALNGRSLSLSALAQTTVQVSDMKSKPKDETTIGSRGRGSKPIKAKRNRLYNAPALEKGLSILEVVAKANRALKTEEIAEAVGRSRNEIYRMLHVLENFSYISRDTKGDGFIATPKLFSLGMHAAPIMDLTAAAMPEMQSLAQAIGHSVQLVVPSDDQIVFIARVESPATFGFSVALGYRRPVLDSTSGRLLFAFQTPEQQERWLQHLRTTAPANVDIAAFLADACSARSTGWLARSSVTVEGVTDICAPIWSSESEGCVANLLVPFMSIIGQRQKPSDVARLCRAAADRISLRLRPHLPAIG